MAKIPVADIRNVAFGGHGAAGKTALLDKILSMTGTITRPASVDDGTSICDFDEEEKVHHHSVEAHVVHFNHDGKRFYAIDTPGYPDFVGQTIGAVHAVDTVVIDDQRPKRHRRDHPPGLQRGGQGRPGPVHRSSTRWTPTTSISPSW